MSSDVAVLGLGNMGAALAREFLKAGHATTVWNRTVSKMQPLIDKGATGVAGLEAAVRAAPLIVVCIERYDQVKDVLAQGGQDGALAKRTVANLTWGTPAEAHAMQQWVTTRGAAYLDGNILDYPDNVCEASVMVPWAGSKDAFEKYAHALAAIGRATYMGEDVALPNVIGSAGAIAHHVALAGFFEAAAYANHFGVTPATYFGVHRTVTEPLTAHAVALAVEHMESGDYTTDQAKLNTHYDAGLVNRDDVQAIGQDGKMIGMFCELLEPLVAQHGELAISKVYEKLRDSR